MQLITFFCQYLFAKFFIPGIESISCYLWAALPVKVKANGMCTNEDCVKTLKG